MENHHVEIRKTAGPLSIFRVVLVCEIRFDEADFHSITDARLWAKQRADQLGVGMEEDLT